jgi:hypothetical protein
MDRSLLPHSQDYGKITSYIAAVARFDHITSAWWKRLQYDMCINGQSTPNTWEEVKRLARQCFCASGLFGKAGQSSSGSNCTFYGYDG